MAWANVQSNKGTSAASATTFGVAFTTANITVGNRIRVQASIWNSLATTVTSVTDSAGNAYALDKRVSVSDNTDVTIWSAPITAGGGTKPTVTLHASGSTSEWALEIFEDSGLAGGTTGYLDGTAGAATSAAGATVSSGASSPAPGVSNEMAAGGYGDGGNSTTITVGSGWSAFLFTGAASTTAEAASETQNSTSGTGSNATFGVSPTGSPAGALVAIYKLAAAGVAAPQIARTALKRTVATPRGRATLAGAGPPAARPTTARERLVPRVATPRGQARVAGPGPLAARPLTARERLVAFIPGLRGRARVAGPGPLAQPPITARGRLVATPRTVRSRAVAIARISAVPLVSRARLVATLLVRRGRGLVARPGPLAAAPTQARERLVRTLPALRGRALVATAIVRPPLVARGFVRGVVRVVRGALARLEAFVVVIVATPAKVTGAVSAVNTLVGAASATYTVAGTASAAYLVAGAASAAYSVSGAVSAPYTVAGAVFPVPT